MIQGYRHSQQIVGLCVLVGMAGYASRTTLGQGLTSQLVSAGLTRAVDVTAAPGDASRLFVVEQAGKVRIIDLTSQPPALVAAPYLDIESLVLEGGERGLLGLAFDPAYAANGHFYVFYTTTGGSIIIARYTVSGNPMVADSGSALVLKNIPHSDSAHNGGGLRFGPDGYLYASTGDNVDGDNSQDGANLLGKLLRLDVANPPDYVPASNPYVGPGDPLDEIWAFGLRNPWRFSFDRLTGDLYIGDVGYGTEEEIDFTPVGGNGGLNYGWPCYEGNAGPLGPQCGPTLEAPIHAYPHGQGAAVIGGYVYRGSAICGLQGVYFYADFIQQQVWTFRVVGGVATDLQDRSGVLTAGAGDYFISCFGEDAAGELYFAAHNFGPSTVYKIVATPAASIVAVDPPNNTLDPRQDLSLGGAPAGLTGLQVTFSGPIESPQGLLDVDCGAAGDCPTIAAVTGTGAGPYTVTLTGPIPPGACTRLTFNTFPCGPNNPIAYRFLPGDVTLDETVSITDVLTLVSAVNAGSALTAVFDINRSGIVAASDILREVQLLNGVNSTSVWLGATLACR